ncbi:MAG: DUF3325 family protein [Pseudomonadota bacterium]
MPLPAEPSTFALAGLSFAYASCVLFFQSGERRAKHPAVVVPAPRMAFARVAGWAMLPLSWACFIAASGVEVGTAIWLGVLALAGILSLLITAVLPKYHLASLLAVLGVSSVATLMAVLQGDLA